MFKTINPQDATAGCKRMLDTAGVILVADALGDVNVTIIELGRKDDSNDESEPAEGDAE